MAFTRSSITTATRARGRTRSKSMPGGAVIEGLDALVRDIEREADEIRPRAEKVVVDLAAKAAQRQRDRVPVDEGDLLDSITSDRSATEEGTAVYADAGPDKEENPGGFKGHMIERGTVKMDPQPFVGPSADETLPELEDAVRNLSRL